MLWVKKSFYFNVTHYGFEQLTESLLLGKIENRRQSSSKRGANDLPIVERENKRPRSGPATLSESQNP
jgi:hypothetical protein